MPPAVIEPTISEGGRPQTYALHRAATGTGINNSYKLLFHLIKTHKISVPKTDWFGFKEVIYFFSRGGGISKN
jgi:hypothetical protein